MDSFEEIYTLYWNDVYKFILRLTEYDRWLAEEITQETFYRAFVGFSKFRGERKKKTWIIGIGRNVFYKYVRSERKRRVFEKGLSEDGQTYADPAADAETVEKCRIVRKIIEKMSEPAKTVVEYRLFGGMSYSEIASALKIREGTAKVIFSRAKVKIINEMKEVYGYEV